MTSGFVWFVGAGPGDPELITLRGWRLIASADTVLYDALVDSSLLLQATGERIDVGKRCGSHSMSQEEISELLVRLARAGRRVVRLKGGDSSVLGRVGEEALTLAEAGIPCEIVPGVSSATAVPSSTGIPVTHRGLADSFLVASAHRQNGEMVFSIPEYAPRTTLILLMARGTVNEWRMQLRAGGYPDLLPVALISKGCTPQQQIVVTTVEKVAEDLQRAALATPLMAVVGWVVTVRERIGRCLSQHVDSAGATWRGLDAEIVGSRSNGVPCQAVAGASRLPQLNKERMS